MAGGSTLSCKVWEWQRDDGGFSPFSPQDSAKIEADFRASPPATSTITISGCGTLDFKRMVMVQPGSRRERGIRCSTVTLPMSPIITSYWTWNEMGTNFVPYSIDAVVDIELAYQRSAHGGGSHTSARSSRRLNSVDLSKCPSQLPYTIDFSAMEQTRHGYGTRRRIRREAIPAGQSLQGLLQNPPPTTSLARGLVTLSSGGKSSGKSGITSGGFSLSGPATSMLKSGTSSGGVGTSLTPSPAPVAILTSGGTTTAPSTSHARPAAKGKGRGKKSSSLRPLGRGGRTKSGDAGAGVPEYVTLERTLKPADHGPCPICLCELSEQSGYEEGCVVIPAIPYAPPVDLCKLRKCGHMMHRACLLMMLKSDSAKNGLTCPTCKKVYGIKTGDMPDGTMNVRHTRQSLPGHEEHGTIEIVYNFSPGVYKGCRYRTNGFPRTCYLPDSPKGQKVLKLLRVAWERRLTFTIGTSVTTGATDTVVWNEIHHKTESSSNYSGHGYPDPNYLDNVLMELSLQGVEDSDTASLSSSSSSDSL